MLRQSSDICVARQVDPYQSGWMVVKRDWLEWVFSMNSLQRANMVKRQFDLAFSAIGVENYRYSHFVDDLASR